MIEALIGLLGGLLIGSTGAGIGLIVTPLLIVAGYSPGTAIATGVGALVAGKLVGSVVHGGMGRFSKLPTSILIGGGAAGVALAWLIARAGIAQGLAADEWLKKLVAAALLISAAALFFPKQKCSPRATEHAPRSFSRFSRNHPLLLFCVGVGSGAPVALTSMGSGSLLGPALLLVTDWDVPSVAAASNFFGFATGALALAVHAGFGTCDWTALAKVLVGLLPGVVVGALISRFISRERLGYAVAVFSIFLGARMLLG